MTGTDASMASKFTQQAGRGRSLIIVALAEVVLFVVANVTYGSGTDKHGAMRTVSNVLWVFFLVGFVVLAVFAIANLIRVVARRGGRGHESI